MARRDGMFLVVAGGLALLAWSLIRPKRVANAPATSTGGATGGGVPGSPHQPVYAEPGVPFTYGTGWTI